MPIWSNQPITEEPEYVLTSWSVFEVQLAPEDPITTHLAGELADRSGEGKVSSRIRAFDAVEAAFRTSSGRVYSVVGNVGLGREGSYVWSRWRAMWPSQFEPRDLTADFAQAIASARGFQTYKEMRLAEYRRRRRNPADPDPSEESSE